MTPFRFDSATHTYFDEIGEPVRHITGMLKATGWIDERWFTEESSDRGQAVHTLTADFDLGALDLSTCVSPFRGFLLAHVKAISMLRPRWIGIEEPEYDSHFRFAGRPDRTLLLGDVRAVLEVKSGLPRKSDQIQTALQAILVRHALGLPPHAIQRYALYLKRTGRFRLVPHPDVSDFAEAYRIIEKAPQPQKGAVAA